MDLRQTKEYGEYLKKRGWIVEKAGEAFVFIRKMPIIPVGIMKVQHWNGELDWDRLTKLMSEHRVVYSVLEPVDDTEMPPRWRLSKDAYLPTATVILDLRKSEDKLLGEVSKDVRQWIRKNQNVEVRVVDEKKLDDFQKEWSKWGKIYVPDIKLLRALSKAFGDRCKFLAITDGEKILAGTVILYSSDSAFYYYAWTSDLGRRLGLQYKLVWEAIRQAKKDKMKWWDFEGVEDGRWPRKSWRGFSLFKKKWGGVTKKFPGSYQRWF